jgi:colanic acid/amylovoran biosynthesis glycosyltransferase
MNRPLRIAVFLGTFPVVSETFILRQITGLIDLGHQVDIYADTPAIDNGPVQPEIARYQLMERTTYMRIPPASAPWEMPTRPIGGKTWLPGAEKPIRNAARLAEALPVFFSSLWRASRLTVRSIMRRHFGHQAESLSTLYRVATLSQISKRYDVLHAHFGPIGNSFRFARDLFQAPFLVSFHGYDFSTVPQKSGRQVYDQLFHTMDAATVNSDYMGKGLEELGCPRNKIHKVPYGLELEKFKRAEIDPVRGLDEPLRVLTVGRLVEKKGIEDSIRAFATIVASHPKAVYDIIGEGPLRARLENLIAELNLQSRVKLLGAMDNLTVRKFFAAADIFMLASVTASNGDKEGTPVSIIEAQAFGLPVLSTRHSGIPEIVQDGKTGFLIEERDASALAERLSLLLEDSALRNAMGRMGREFTAQFFNAKHTTRRLADLYRALANERLGGFL